MSGYRWGVERKKKILEKEKLIVTVAHDGLAAVNKVKEQDFDIVLMDLQMPIMDGYNATKAIRKFNPTIPILALSANVFDEVKDKIDVALDILQEIVNLNHA